MATHHSNRRRPRATLASSASPTPTSRRAVSASGKKAVTRPDLDEILGHFSEALALVETAHTALDAAQETAGVGRAIGAAVLTVERGLAELRRTYTELDLAIPRLR